MVCGNLAWRRLLAGCWGHLRRWASGWRDGGTEATAPPVCAGTRATAGERREPALIDLSDEWGLTYEMLDDTQAWRERAVHEISLRDSDHVDAVTAYQIRMPLELVHRYAQRAHVGDRVRLLLPFAVRSKSLLLNVDLVGAEGSPASLLLKRHSDLLQTGYLSHLDDRLLDGQASRGVLWAGISGYTPWAWREHYVGPERRARRLRWLGRTRGWREEALARYLNTDLELGIDAGQVAKWLQQTEDARMALVESLGEGEDPESPSEWILLAIPFMPVRPREIADIDLLIA